MYNAKLIFKNNKMGRVKVKWCTYVRRGAGQEDDGDRTCRHGANNNLIKS